MADLLSQENVDQFRAAMRSVTDTFHKSPVTLLRPSGEEIDLMSGITPDEVGSYGEIDGERYVQDERTERTERKIVSLNRDYLAERALVDPDTDELLIAPDADWIVIGGKRFGIDKMTDKAVFRGVPILVQLTVQR
jgi:hypothetical protein